MAGTELMLLQTQIPLVQPFEEITTESQQKHAMMGTIQIVKAAFLTALAFLVAGLVQEETKHK